MHVVNARRAGRHTGKARQAAVDVLDGFGVGRALVFQHILDQVDAPAGAIKFIAQDLIGRAGRGAKPAMHAGAQDFIGAFGAGLGQLLWRKSGLHQDMIPVIENVARVEFGTQTCGDRGDRARVRGGTWACACCHGSVSRGLQCRPWHGAGRGLSGAERPDQPAAPVILHGRRAQFGSQCRGVGGLDGDAPDVTLVIGEGVHVADRGPVGFGLGRRAKCAELFGQVLRAVGHGGCKPLKAEMGCGWLGSWATPVTS